MAETVYGYGIVKYSPKFVTGIIPVASKFSEELL
jgi:hypothetical protein